MTEAGNNCLLKIYLWFENNVSKLTKLKKKVKCRFEHVQFTKDAQHKECSNKEMISSIGIKFVLFCFINTTNAFYLICYSPQMKIMIPF